MLPALLTLAAVKWLFGTISSFTDTLLFFLPWSLPPAAVYKDGVSGTMFWYWSALALFLAVALISGVGVLTRYYIGKKIIDWTDRFLLRVPFLNKIYAAIKQVNAAFSGSKHSFQTVVLVEFPRPGAWTIGFITSDQPAEIKTQTYPNVVCVFVPTTPNPTAGFLLLVPEDQVRKLDMSVADGIKYLISLGSVSPASLEIGYGGLIVERQTPRKSPAPARRP
jgi:uncharacterized membrane protein